MSKLALIRNGLTSPEHKKLVDTAAEEGMEEGRAEWRPYVADAVSTAVKEAITPLKDQFDANITELRAFHASHIKAVGAHKFWRGFAIGGVVLAVIAGLSIWQVGRDMQLVNAASRGIEQRQGQDVLPAPRLCVPGVDEDCPADTVSRDSGYARPGREPASAR